LLFKNVISLCLNSINEQYNVIANLGIFYEPPGILIFICFNFFPVAFTVFIYVVTLLPLHLVIKNELFAF